MALDPGQVAVAVAAVAEACVSISASNVDHQLVTCLWQAAMTSACVIWISLALAHPGFQQQNLEMHLLTAQKHYYYCHHYLTFDKGFPLE